ncbi:MAG TPA: hypothetical protein VES42_25570, partial [Pilimelia sp.]|nr:hypothetical protein [Pilimelia sp.]
PRLRRTVTGPVAAVLPGLPGQVLDRLLARTCRAPAATDAPAHPADTAVGGAVLATTLAATRA